MTNILGIHHVTAIAGDPQRNVDFYTGVLGLRLVKKTVNFDDPYIYHLYFGDESGSPGTLLTFFPWSAQARRGRRGTGQLRFFSFSIPNNSLGFWKDKLKKLRIDFNGQFTRFGEEGITVRDHDGFEFDLIESKSDSRAPRDNGFIPATFAIRGFHSVTLLESSDEQTSEFLTSTLEFHSVEQSNNRSRFRCSDEAGTIIDIVHQPETQRGTMGVGIVHHVAWRVPDDQTQLRVRETLINRGYDVTPVIDRNYFHSIYFHEPGGVLFEVATDPPGFLIDEAKDELGTHLKLPIQYELYRDELEKSLPPIHIAALKNIEAD